MSQNSLGPAAPADAAEARETDRLGGTIVSKNKSPARISQAPKSGGRSPRQKGNVREREAVNKHLAIGVHSERYPLSGASRFRGKSHDIDVYAFGKDEPPLPCEVKARCRGKGFAVLQKWLGEHDALFLRRNNAEPTVVLPWRVWARLLERVRR
jgi:hypothetical protein